MPDISVNPDTLSAPLTSTVRVHGKRVSIMPKKLALVLVALLFTAVQGLFIYALEHGAKEQYLAVWSSFEVPVPAYTHFVFRTASWWWAGPAICLALLTVSLYRRSRGIALAACFASFALAAALLWSAYAPNLLVRV